MSRSYREGIIVDGYGSTVKTFFKRQANRTVRRLPLDSGIADGKAYRRYTNPWDICDYRFPARVDIIRLDNGHRIISIDPKPYRK